MSSASIVGLVRRELFGDRRHDRGEVGVFGLLGELLGPVAGEPEVAAAVVDLTDPAGGGLVLVEQPLGGAVECLAQHTGAGVAVGRLVAEALGQGEELTEAVPAQVVLLHELLHVLGGGAARARLEQAAAVHQRDDREHLRARAQLEDREEVRVVVAQHVAGDRDGVLTATDPLDREGGRLHGGEDAQVEAVGVVVWRGRSRPATNAELNVQTQWTTDQACRAAPLTLPWAPARRRTSKGVAGLRL